VALDAICLAAVSEELRGRITGLRIEKVQQPERDMIILSLRGGDAPACRLLISSGSGDARLHLTGYKFENPSSPPMFCMLLRKHLLGARIINITQPSAERVVKLLLHAPDAMGFVSEKSLIVELIGHHSNIILSDSDGIIIDCMRHIGGEISIRRDVLPGLIYRLPPAQPGKLDPFSVNIGEWQDLFSRAAEKTTDEWLLSNFSALSPLICRELSWRAYGQTDFRIDWVSDAGAALSRAFFSLIGEAVSGRFEPCIITDLYNAPREFSYTRIRQYENAANVQPYENFSAMLDDYFTHAAQIVRFRQRAAATSKTVRTAHDRLIRKLAAQKAELEKTASRSSLRECADIIMANLHLMNKGQSTLVAQDFYSEDGATREIALDHMKTPQQNAQRYYRNYAKAKNTEKFLTEQIQLGENELEYLKSVITGIELADGTQCLSEIRSELSRTGYIKPQKNGKTKQVESQPMRFESSAGMQILAGRNNMQNDRLTLKTAAKSDVWLHAQKSHGAHVIVSCYAETPDEQTLYEAASIAAYFSSARLSGKVPVDYTLVKQVKKPPGGRPGMVKYTDYKTIIAAPDEELVKRLRR